MRAADHCTDVFSLTNRLHAAVVSQLVRADPGNNNKDSIMFPDPVNNK